MKTEAQKRADKKWREQNIDRLTIHLKKKDNVKERVKALGFAFNTFVNQAILEKLEELEKSE